MEGEGGEVKGNGEMKPRGEGGERKGEMRRINTMEITEESLGENERGCKRSTKGMFKVVESCTIEYHVVSKKSEK